MPAADNDKRARFCNLIQLIQLTTTILNEGRGPKLPSHSDEPVPSKTSGPTTVPSKISGPYTYLDAAARLLVRKDEIIAAAECTSFRKDSDPTLEVAVVATQMLANVMTNDDDDDDDVWDHTPPSLTLGELPGTYITNPDFSFRHDKLSEDQPKLLYQSSERSVETLWNDIKGNAWHYLSLYVS